MSTNANKPLTYYDHESGQLYGEYGEVFQGISLDERLAQVSQVCFVESLNSPAMARYIHNWCGSPHHKVLADEHGHVLAARLAFGRTTSWLVPIERWDDSWKNSGPAFVETLRPVFSHLGVGVAPTPSSLGRATMRYVYDVQKLHIHTALPLAVEDYFHRHGFGGIVVTPRDHVTYPQATQLDMSSAYVSRWEAHPDGTAEYFHRNYGVYATWFGEVEVQVPSELALGLFPIRKRNGRVQYPTKKGIYRTHLWKESAELAEAQGCKVSVKEGWGWPSITHDSEHWAEWIYFMRATAENEFIERMVKKVAVSAIGSMARSRIGYTVVSDELYDPETDSCVVVDNMAIDLWCHPDYDSRSALMGHWNDYTVSSVNRAVREFAYPFAAAGSLVLIDYDSVFTIDESSQEKYIKKHSIENILVQPGTWLWKAHHNFQVLRNRMWISDEEPRRYGSLLKGVMSGQ